MIGNSIDAALSCALPVSWSCALRAVTLRWVMLDTPTIGPSGVDTAQLGGRPLWLSATGPGAPAYTQVESAVVVELAVDSVLETPPRRPWVTLAGSCVAQRAEKLSRSMISPSSIYPVGSKPNCW